MAFSLFKFIKKTKPPSMSDDTPSTTSGPFGLTTTTATDDKSFLQAYEAAKLNDNWQRVTTALKAHPDWLIKIPQNRRWTMMHQIVFSGNRQHLDEVLAYQISDPNFRLLFKAADGKTVRDVAFERQHIHKQMLIHIERLIFCDQMLNNAKEGKWNVVKSAIRQKTDVANEKPPYRRRYLVHQLAARGLLNEFKEINEITQLRIDLLAEGQNPMQLARAKGHNEFANYLEALPPMAATGHGAPSSSASSGPPPGQPKYSPGFYDDISISIMPVGGGASFSIHGGGSSSSTFNPPYSHHALAMGPTLLVDTHHAYEGGHSHSYSGSGASGYGGGGGGGASGGSHHSSSGKTSTKKPVVPAISEDDLSKYEKAVTANADKVSGTQLLDSVTCCITKQIMRDPVMAADGFTYEREAIMKWFEHSKRSPMTNQELENLELKPNHAIKSILNSLQGSSASASGKSKQKDSEKK